MTMLAKFLDCTNIKHLLRYTQADVFNPSHYFSFYYDTFLVGQT